MFLAVIDNFSNKKIQNMIFVISEHDDSEE